MEFVAKYISPIYVLIHLKKCVNLLDLVSPSQFTLSGFLGKIFETKMFKCVIYKDVPFTM